jgi:hypothetical protein
MRYSKVICKVCDTSFEVMTWKLNQGRGKTCSIECRREWQKQFVSGNASKHWKGGEFYRNGYRYILEPSHPLANKNGYVAEHRKVLMEKIGRPLKMGRGVEIAHHINEDKLDNRPENLEVLSQSEHSKHHQTIYLSCICGARAVSRGMCQKHYVAFRKKNRVHK